MSRIFTLPPFLLLLTFHVLTAQPLLTRYYSEPPVDEYSVGTWPFRDDQLISFTLTNHTADQGWDVRLLFLSATGEHTDQRLISLAGDQLINVVLPLPDGGFLLGGSSSESIGLRPRLDSYLLRLNADAEVEWSTTLPYEGFDEIGKLALLPNGDYIVSISRLEPENYIDDIMIRMDSNGNRTWEKNFNKKYSDDITAIDITADGNIIVAGRFKGNPRLSQLNIDGEVMWEQDFSSPNEIGGQDLRILDALSVGTNGEVLAIIYYSNAKYALVTFRHGEITDYSILSGNLHYVTPSKLQPLGDGSIAGFIVENNNTLLFRASRTEPGRYEITSSAKANTNVKQPFLNIGQSNQPVFSGRDDQGNTLIKAYDLSLQQKWEQRHGSPNKAKFGSFSAAAPLPGGGYMMLGRTTAPGENNCLKLIKVNETGDILWRKTIDEKSNYLIPTIKLGQDGIIHIIGSGGDFSTGEFAINYSKYNLEGELLREFAIAFDELVLTEAVELLPDETAIIISYYSLYTSEEFLTKVDTMGNTLWTNSIEESESIGRLYVDEAGNTYAAVYLLEFNHQLRKFDPDGRLLWAKSPGSIDKVSVGNMIAAGDGNFVLAGEYHDDYYVLSDTNTLYLAKLDPAGNMIWEKFPEEEANVFSLPRIILGENEELLMLYNYRNSYRAFALQDTLVITTLTSEGAQVDKTSLRLGANFDLKSVEVLKGNRLMIAAEAFYANANTWILTVNSYPSFVGAPEVLAVDELRLSPVPTSSHLNVTLDNDEAGPVHLSIVDMQGRVVKQWVVNKAAEMMVQPLDISELSPGAYTLLARGGKTLARGRFVKL